MHIKCASFCVAVFSLANTSVFGANDLEFNYQGLTLDFDSNTSVLALEHNEGSQSLAILRDGNGQRLNSTFTINSDGDDDVFELLFTGLIQNPVGDDNIRFLDSEFRSTDIDRDLDAPSLLAALANSNLSGDIDGVSFGSGVLRVEGRIFTVSGNESILINPLDGDWTHKGELGNAITISDDARDSYDSGILAILEVNINEFNDRTSTRGLNADQLFAQALIHGGFTTDSAQLQLTIVPAPAAVLLGGAGLGLVGWWRRRS